MSDEEDNFEETEESNEDFSSGSEDDWKPDTIRTTKSGSDTDINDDDFEETPPKKNNRFSLNISHRSQQINRNGRISLSLNNTKKHFPLSQSVKNTKSSTIKKTTNNEESDSGSSGDDCLVDPNKIDLASSFFCKNTSLGSNIEKEPVFECDGGMNITDSDDNDSEMENVTDNQNSFQTFFEFNKNVEEIKEKIKNLETEQKVEQNIDVSSLLAMGESSKSLQVNNSISSKNRKKIKVKQEHSDSDWEEVEEHNVNETTVHEKDLQVTVSLPQNERRVKKITDEQASLMRQLNRVIKENHIISHKVSLLCHIAHGIYLNRALNNTNLMSEALKLLPNKKCYPDGRTDIKYFESIIKWYKSIMKIKSDEIYSTLKKRPPIPISLALQIKYKEAICKKDFILIFIVLLRGMGIQCRLIMNLVPMPLRPAPNDLCTIKLKKPDVIDAKKKSSSSKNTSVKIIEKEQKKEQNVKQNTKEPRKKIHVEKDQIISPRKTRYRSNLKELKDVASKENKKSSIKEENKCTVSSTKGKKHSTVTKTSLNSQENTESPKIKLRKLNINIEKNDKTTIPEIKVTKTKSSETKTIKTRSKPLSKKSNNNQPKSRSPSPKFHISPLFTQANVNIEESTNKKLLERKKATSSRRKNNSPTTKIHISPLFIQSKSTTDSQAQPTTETNNKTLRTRKVTRNALSVPQMDGGNDELNISSNKSLSEKLQKVKSKRKSSNNDSDEDFEVSPPKKSKQSNEPVNKVIGRLKRDRRVLSTDCEESPKKTNKNSIDIWIEVYCEVEEKWVTIELFKSKVHCVDSIRKQATSPISYVFAWNNDNSLKDVSARYCPQWNTTTRKMRVEKDWLNEAIRSFRGKKTVRDKAEDRELDKIHLDKPLPQTISEYKNHPLYALKRHLLKFEGIYPPNAVTLGFVRGEPVYPRDCVHTLHSREIWLKSARVVKPSQQPYKIVKARPKWDKVNSKVIKDLPLEIFGYWQTMEYEPPTAENGIVPRNAYGNVELFKSCMLPKKTVHLQLPGLNRVCKKLQIDCAPAVIGFDFHQGSCHPLLDGFVICEEFADLVVDAWHKDQEEMERREEEKYQLRVFGNWKKLIKGLLIRQRLKKKYNFNDVEETSGSSKRKKKN